MVVVSKIRQAAKRAVYMAMYGGTPSGRFSITSQGVYSQLEARILANGWTKLEPADEFDDLRKYLKGRKFRRRLRGSVGGRNRDEKSRQWHLNRAKSLEPFRRSPKMQNTGRVA